ncbi:MAG: response regulator [Deltaproteobacteria bacterium]|nr:MAG: response regulator [Deltaproteobacteria bacterium]
MSARHRRAAPGPPLPPPRAHRDRRAARPLGRRAAGPGRVEPRRQRDRARRPAGGDPRPSRRPRSTARHAARREPRRDPARRGVDPVRAIPQPVRAARAQPRPRPRPVHLQGDRHRASRHDRGAIDPRGRYVLRDRAPQERGGARVILIVEDEVHCRDTLCDALVDEGYSVDVARDGHEAMDKLATARPALLILDLRMPGMSGNTLYDEMQKSPELAGIPVLVTTADPARAPRGVPILAKPLRLDKLLSLVAFACGRV